MRYGFEIASLAGGVAMLLLANFIVIEFLPFVVPIFNMMGALLIVLPPVMAIYTRYSLKREIEEQFVSFVMDLTDSIDSGMTLPMALEHCSKRDYQALSKHVSHLVAQVNWGVPFKKALESFARKTRSRSVQRAVSTIVETYRVGGKISDTLNSVTKSMVTMNKLDTERKSSVYSQVVTSYMIFLIFIFIMVVIQVFILPSLSQENIGDFTISGSNQLADNQKNMYTGVSYDIEFLKRDYNVTLIGKYDNDTVYIDVDGTVDAVSISEHLNLAGLPMYMSSVNNINDTHIRSATFLFGEDVPPNYPMIFTIFIIIQGFFAGLATGKMSEGSIPAGLKHSVILVFIGYAIFTLAAQLPQIQLF